MATQYVKQSWRLDQLFSAVDHKDIDAAFAEAEALAVAFEQIRPTLRPGLPVEEMMAAIEKIETITRLLYRIEAYAQLRFASDTQDQPAQNLMAKVNQFAASIINRTLFFSLWWKGLDDTEAARLMDESDQYRGGDYRYWLEEMRNFKPHTLSEPEEKIINIKDTTGSRAIQTLYDTLTNRYVFKLEVDGEFREMTHGELMVYVRQPDPELRARAYQEMYRVYSQDSIILGQMYQTLARDWKNEQLDLRRFSSPISARNLANDIPDEAVETLLQACKRNAPLFQRFFQLKARWLGMERLRRYDIYAPVVTSDKHYPYESASEKVLESFREFHPDFAEMAERVFAQEHLDSEVRKGKMSGAFCLTALPDVTPWVLLNYQGRSNDVTTMAHELGHAIHSMIAADHTIFTFHASLPLAETASTFGEMMLVDRLLAEESDEDVRRDLLFRQMDNAYATIMRQAYFAIFERAAHQAIQEGAGVDDLAKMYLENIKEQFGDSLELNDEFRWEWIAIPHIFQVPFYVYAYAFGQLLVFSLYKQFKTEGEAFKPRYMKILAAGGSDAPKDILADAGIDICSAEFWQGGFDVIESMIEQLEAIAVPGS